MTAYPAWYDDCVAFARNLGNFDKIGMCTHEHCMLKKFGNFDTFRNFFQEPTKKIELHELKAQALWKKHADFEWSD